MRRVLRAVRWQCVLVLVGAAAFGLLLVWLYELIGNAVWLPFALSALVYVELRVSGLAEQIRADLAEVVQEEHDNLREDLDLQWVAQRDGKWRDRG